MGIYQLDLHGLPVDGLANNGCLNGAVDLDIKNKRNRHGLPKVELCNNRYINELILFLQGCANVGKDQTHVFA